MHPAKITLKSEIIPILLIVASIAASFYFYANFPDKVATHWNYQGEVDGWSSKAFAAFFFPGLNLAMYLLFLGMPYLDPKKDRYVEFSKSYNAFKTIMILVMTVIYFFVGLSGLGYKLPVAMVIPPAVGILFVVLGNYLGKIKPNWFIGIRTPWTLSSEEVWNKTHRLGGKIFIIFGLFMIFGVFLPESLFWWLFIALIVPVMFLPIIYSYFLFRKIKR